MGRRSVRIGVHRGKTSWWPAVRQHLIENDERWLSAKDILDEARLLKYPHRPLLQSRHCPRPDKLSHYLGSVKKDVVLRKKERRITSLTGSTSETYVYRWLGEDDNYEG